MRLNYTRTFFVGLAFMSISAFSLLYDGLIPLILKNNFLLGQTEIGMIMSLDNLLAIFLLPLFGALSDRVQTRFGRRTPFIVVGTFFTTISMMFLPFSVQTGSLAMFMVALPFVLLSMAVYRSPAVALMPDLTPKPLRSKANAIINLMGAVGGLYTLVMIKAILPKAENTDEPVLVSSGQYFLVFGAVAALMVVAVVILVLTIREKKFAAEVPAEPEEQTAAGSKEKLPPAVKKSLIFLLSSVLFWFFASNAVQTGYSLYAQEVLGLQGGGFADGFMILTISSVVSFIPIGFLSTYIGRKKVILFGIALMTVCYLVAIPITSGGWLMSILFVLVGIGWAAINVNSYPMVIEMSKNSDTGKYTGLYYTFSMGAQVVTPILSGYLIEHLSIGYRVLFPYAAIFMSCAFATMLFVKHGDNKPALPKDKLELLDS